MDNGMTDFFLRNAHSTVSVLVALDESTSISSARKG